MPVDKSMSQNATPVWITGADGNPTGTPASPLRSATEAAPSTASSTLSGSIAASGGTVTIIIANTARYEVLNPSNSTLWASWGTPAVNGVGSFPINAGGSYGPPDRTAGTLTLLSTAVNQNYTVNRFA